MLPIKKKKKLKITYMDQFSFTYKYFGHKLITMIVQVHLKI